MQDYSYLSTPFLAWLVAGCSKFAINTIKARKLALAQIGYGGLPSNHSAIVSSMAALIFFKEGLGHPAFGVAVALCFIVMLDANSLRQKIGEQAAMINQLTADTQGPKLRERMGHTKLEIAAGIIVGSLTAWCVTLLPF